uniref:Uncharacterized protein n=1 Tax=Anopheles atroparvus TaxID=41427 RepID=A0AAG5D5D8_ANOAO
VRSISDGRTRENVGTWRTVKFVTVSVTADVRNGRDRPEEDRAQERIPKEVRGVGRGGKTHGRTLPLFVTADRGKNAPDSSPHTIESDYLEGCNKQQQKKAHLRTAILSKNSTIMLNQETGEMEYETVGGYDRERIYLDKETGEVSSYPAEPATIASHRRRSKFLVPKQYLRSQSGIVARRTATTTSTMATSSAVGCAAAVSNACKLKMIPMTKEVPVK